MKRISICLLVLLILGAAAGCGAPPPKAPAADTSAVVGEKEPVRPPATNEVRQEAASAPPVNAMPPSAPSAKETVRYMVERTVRKETILAEDGVRLAEICYQLPELTAVDAAENVITEENAAGERQQRALEIVAAFAAKFDVWRQDDGTLMLDAGEDYKVSPERFRDGIYYVEELDFSAWQTERLVSVRADSYSYYGGAHPNTMLLGWNFDLETGTYINALTIGHDEQEFRTLVAEQLILLADERAASLQQEPTAMYWEDYRSILQNWNDYPVIFDADGMTVRFSAYELGSYAAGPHEFTLGYDFLEPHLSDYGCELLGLAMTS